MEVEYIADPIMIISGGDETGIKFVVVPAGLDPQLSDAGIFGIVLSDMVDHVAQCYHDITGEDIADIKHRIYEVINGERDAKEKDPERSKLVGKTRIRSDA